MPKATVGSTTAADTTAATVTGNVALDLLQNGSGVTAEWGLPHHQRSCRGACC